MENIDNFLIEVIRERACDLVVLAEYGESISKLCEKINAVSESDYKPIPNNNGCDRIKGLIKSKYRIVSIQEQARYQIVMIETTLYKLLIGMIHNLSKLDYSERSQEALLNHFNYDLCEAEKSQDSNNTMVLGDFNVDPFEPACIAANTLHAIPFVEEVETLARVVSGIEYHKFYNPTWKLMGRKDIPYATCYYNKSDIVNYYWHMFDQVIIRPQLIPAFQEDSLTIIEKSTSHNLLMNKKPNSKNYSDHLPLFYKLKEEKIP